MHRLICAFVVRIWQNQVFSWCGSYKLSPVKQMCVFEHSVMTNFNCSCPAIQRGQESGFLKVPLGSLLVWASSGGSGETARMRRLAWTFAARKGDKYQIRLTRPNWCQGVVWARLCQIDSLIDSITMFRGTRFIWLSKLLPKFLYLMQTV